MGGSYFNFPEHSCCECGLGKAPVDTAPKSTFGCTHSESNRISSPLIEFCGLPGLTKT